jgi:HK97 family phage portal protein
VSFLTALLGPSEQKSISIDDLWSRIEGGMSSKAGPPVNWQNALRVSVAFSCARVLAEGIAQIPLKLMQEEPTGGSRAAREHSLYQLLARRPNDWMTSFEFRETMMFHAIFAKGGYAIINRGSGKVRELIPVMPECVRIEQNADASITYWINLPDGTYRPFPKSSIFHLRGPSWNGIEGLDVIDLAREALGLAIATEETHARFHANGAKAAGIISMDGELKAEGRAALKKAFQDATTGGNAYKTLVLDQGAKFAQMSMTGVDSQHLETRRHQIEEVCRFMRVFPQMAGYSDKTSTFASAEQFFIAHVVHSLGPWNERWEQSLDRDLLTKQEIAQGYFTKLSVQGLMRGDVTSRSSFYASAITNGYMTRNEVRALEDLNPIDGLDEPLIPLNMVGANDPTPQDAPTPDTTAQDQQVAKAIADIGEVKSLFHMQTLASKNEQKAPNITVNMGEIKLNLPENVIKITNEAAKQADVVVNVPEVQPPVVNVYPQAVNVAAPIVNVAPANVKVDVAAPNVNFEAVMPEMPAMPAPNVIVSLPTRKTETTVTRDTYGNILTATQIEKDA